MMHQDNVLCTDMLDYRDCRLSHSYTSSNSGELDSCLSEQRATRGIGSIVKAIRPNCEGLDLFSRCAYFHYYCMDTIALLKYTIINFDTTARKKLQNHKEL